jgi:hypothetical protein
MRVLGGIAISVGLLASARRAKHPPIRVRSRLGEAPLNPPSQLRPTTSPAPYASTHPFKPPRQRASPALA